MSATVLSSSPSLRVDVRSPSLSGPLSANRDVIVSPVKDSFAPLPSRQELPVQQQLSVYDILSSSLRFKNDDQFWWNTCGRILSNMFSLLRYDVHVQYMHMLFFHVRVAPYMGARPRWNNEPAVKSYMTDDHSPIEVSWLVNEDGTATVRYAIEPMQPESQKGSGKSAALQMIDDLRPVLDDLNMQWFDTLNEKLIWNNGEAAPGAKHNSQYFLGFDCAHSGTVTLKAYFLPEVRCVATGIAKDRLVLDALAALNAGLTTPWSATTKYFDTLPHAIRPSVEIVATDCAEPSTSRIKVYVRTRSTKFADLEGMMTLGGRLKGRVVSDAMRALEDLWRTVMGVDTSAPGWKHRRLTPRVSAEANDNHITGGLLLYYELKPGHALPFPKVYLPVRHYCQNDLAIAQGMQAYHGEKGRKFVDSYVNDVESIFGSHRSLESRTGIHTYVSLAIKKSDFEVTSYFNPEVYAPERVC